MNCLFKKPGGFFVALLLMMSAHAAFDKHKLQRVVPNLKSSVLSALSEQEQEMYRACKPDPTPCFQIQDKIFEIKKDIEICCVNLEQKIDQIMEEVVVLPELCERQTVIDQDFINSATPQITQPGSYCLVEDVTGSLVIDADDVCLLLNGHTMTGASNVIEVAGHNNIFILGSGVIKGGSPNGILMTTCTTVAVQDVFFEGNETGLQFDDVHGIRLNNLSFTGHTTVSMIFANGSCNGKIVCVNIFDNPASLGIDVNGSFNLVFDTCRYSNNNTGASQFRGFRVRNNSSNCNFINCYANNNTTTMGNSRGFLFNTVTDCYCFGCEFNKNQNPDGTSNLDGFFVTDAAKIILDSCLALENTGVNNTSGRGFVINNSEACCIISCVAKTNTWQGFRVFGNSSNNNYLANNIAMDNNSGFALTGAGTDNIFFGNYANGNNTNFDVSTDYAPTFTFDSTMGTFSPLGNRINPVTKWDNIAVDNP